MGVLKVLTIFVTCVIQFSLPAACLYKVSLPATAVIDTSLGWVLRRNTSSSARCGGKPRFMLLAMLERGLAIRMSNGLGLGGM